MTRLANKFGAVNLAQGFPDFPCPAELKEAASSAVFDDYNQYSITWGAPELRDAIAAKERAYNRIDCDPEKNIVVTCGTTEGMVASQLAILDPGDELIIISPHYENYAPDAIISGARPKYFVLSERRDKDEEFEIDEEKLKTEFGPNTRGIVINTPHNPTGKVFSMKDLKLIADLCNDYDAVCFTDEIYEHILYDGATHLSIGSFSSMQDRTVTISGFSKTYSVTGWRVGYTIASEKLTNAIKKVHDFLTVGAPHPLQMACVKALSLPESYYESLRKDYQRKRNLLLSSLEDIGFKCVKPRGAYYIWCDFSELDKTSNDVEFCMHLVEKARVAGVPGSSFFFLDGKVGGRKEIRFTFSKRIETLQAACERLKSSFA